ncbi:MAG: hypothetical protein KatS3mg124_0180 [Porticoccaceae bacterium]|nr:MAG: hypothetical protein KatS3mg124_0180 [Porticoccaceae bacterium]
MNATHSLPEGFAALEPFVARWALPTADARLRARLESSAEEREAFFAAARELVPKALAHLDQKPLADLSPAEEKLLRLVLAAAHVAAAVELQRDQEPRHAEGARHFTITRAPSDRLR